MAARTAATLLDVPLIELHDPSSGRIDAARVADFIGVALPQIAAAVGAGYAAVHKTPDASSLQKGLGPIKRTLALLSRVTRSRREARAWLNSPHPELDERTPLEVILSGHADAVVTLLENAIAGLSRARDYSTPAARRRRPQEGARHGKGGRVRGLR